MKVVLLAMVLMLLQAEVAAAGWDDAAKIPVDKLAARTSVHLAPCPGEVEPSCALPSPARIWVSDPTGKDRLLAWTYYHELGHVMDYLILTDQNRSDLMRAMSLRGAWRSPPNSPHEQFASAFSVCAAFGPKMSARQARSRFVFDRARMYLGYEWMPTLPQQRRVCQMIAGLLA